MARPTKEGLEYFPLDVDIDQDEKVIMVVAKHGMRGFGILIRLMMEIYKNGYFYQWGERERHVFSMKVNESVELVDEVVEECLKWGFFSRELYKSYGILTSKGFQKRFLLATSRRKGIVIKPEFLLIDSVNADNNHDNDDDNPVQLELLPAETPQKKVKEKKVKETNIYEQIIGYLNKKTGKNYSAKSEANKKLINGRLSEGRTIDDFYYVIDVKCSHWLEDEKMCEYLRPSTLFRPSKFDEYLNQAPHKKKADPRDKEIAFRRWVEEGNDENDFDWS
ncbi:conserved phage C-terminal domain-containing protein [Brevibacillus massiliensis]|uniref:conserved phage C-terminal domain-containing protein n=1 Tax=Brevibacillus massiliensis TaxID=1118054 RepID=UPI00030F9B45|nr:conserved phage C-terminal domain-containing protein [Brevibacillus massiliensis]